MKSAKYKLQSQFKEYNHIFKYDLDRSPDGEKKTQKKTRVKIEKTKRKHKQQTEDSYRQGEIKTVSTL